MSSKYDEMKELLLEEELILLNCICDGTPQDASDDLSVPLLTVFNSRKCIHVLLDWCIKKEITRALESQDINGLFRNNALPIKISNEYLKFNSIDYLKAMLLQPLKRILTQKELLEVDPNRMDGKSSIKDMKKNFEKLMTFVEAVLQSVICSTALCPVSVKQLFTMIAKEVIANIPSKRHIAIGGFLFLRLLCPALVSPEGFGFSTITVSPDSRRNLILISKTLQNIANGTEFGANEPYLLNANVYINKTKAAVRTYLASVSSDGDIKEELLRIPGIDGNVQRSLASLHYHISLNRNKILLLYGDSNNDVASLDMLLKSIGEPIRPSKIVNSMFNVQNELRNKALEREEKKKEQYGVSSAKSTVHSQLKDLVNVKKKEKPFETVVAAPTLRHIRTSNRKRSGSLNMVSELESREKSPSGLRKQYIADHNSMYSSAPSVPKVARSYTLDSACGDSLILNDKLRTIAHGRPPKPIKPTHLVEEEIYCEPQSVSIDCNNLLGDGNSDKKSRSLDDISTISKPIVEPPLLDAFPFNHKDVPDMMDFRRWCNQTVSKLSILHNAVVSNVKILEECRKDLQQETEGRHLEMMELRAAMTKDVKAKVSGLRIELAEERKRREALERIVNDLKDLR